MFKVKKFTNGEVEIRPYQKEDISRTVKWLNTPAIKKAFGLTYNIDCDSHEQWLKASSESLLMWAICFGGVHVGDLLIRPKAKHFSSYLQIYIGEEAYHGKGIGATSIRMCIDDLFNERKFHRIELHVSPSNLVAKRLYKRLGFEFEGLEKESVYQNGGFVDQERWALLNHLDKDKS